MSQITSILVAKGKKSRRHIYIDGEFVCTLDEFNVYKYRLKVGSEITREELEQISLESEVDTAFGLALNLISKMQKTTKQVFDYLSSKGYPRIVCNSVVKKLQEYKYVDDEQYAKMYVATYITKYGRAKIKFMLSNKGVSSQIIENVLENAPNQDDVVIEYTKKYMQNKDWNSQNYAKLSRFLANKGFGWSEINSAIGKIKEEIYENRD